MAFCGDIESINAALNRAILGFQESEIEAMVEQSKTGTYKVPSPSKLGIRVPTMPVPKLSTGRFVLDKGVIRRFKKDFLTFMSSAKKVKNYDEAFRVKLAFERWSNKILRDFNQDISNILERSAHYSLDVPKQFKDEAKVLEKNNKLLPLATLSFPAVTFDDEEKRWGETKETLFMNYRERFPKWEKDTRRKAQAAWKWLRSVVDWSLAWTKSPFKVSRFAEVLDVIEGFQVRMIGEPDKKILATLKVALKEYKRRAASRFPALLKYKVRFNVEFESHNILTAAARYGDGVIHLKPWGLRGGKVDSVLYTIAHEMGHHIFMKVLPQHQRAAWIKFWKTDKEPIDLNQLLARQREGEDDDKFIERLKKEDPVLMMRVGAILPEQLGYIHIEDIKDYIARKGNILSVSKHLSTSYSAENPHEFFSEVVAQLIGYGPKTIPKTTLSMLRRVTDSRVDVV